MSDSWESKEVSAVVYLKYQYQAFNFTSFLRSKQRGGAAAGRIGQK